MYCTNCGKEVNEKAVACPSCGFNPKSEKNYCNECGAETKEKQIICTNCGVELKRSSSSFSIDSISITNSLKQTKDFNITALVTAALMIISLFLPWMKSAFGSVNILNSNFNDMIGPYGYFMLFFAIVSAIGVFLKYKQAFIGGILYLLTLTIAIIDIIDKLGRFSNFIDFDKIFTSGSGGVLAIISSLLFIIFSLINIKGETYDFNKVFLNFNKVFLNIKSTIIKFINTEYFKLGLPIFLFLLSIYINSGYSQYYKFPLFEIILLIYPIYYVYNKYKIFVPLLISLIGIQIITYIPRGLFNCHKALCNEITNSILLSIDIAFYIFLISLIVAIINEIKKGEYIPEKIKYIINKFKLIEKNWLYIWGGFIVVLILTLIINLSSLVTLLEDDKQEIVKPFNKISGEWLFFAKNDNFYYDITINYANIKVKDDYGNVTLSQRLTINGENNNLNYELLQDVYYKEINNSLPFNFYRDVYNSEYDDIIIIIKIYKDSLIAIKIYNNNNDTLDIISYRKEYYMDLQEQKRKEEEDKYLNKSKNEYDDNYNTIDSIIADTLNVDTLINNEKIIWYQINDPDGYSNLRKTPGGKIIKKVFLNEKFKVISKEEKYSKVKLEDETIGYIHNSRIIKWIDN